MLSLLLAFCFIGCNGARIDVYEQQDDDYRYFTVDFVLPKALETALNDSAASISATEKWTVQKWLRTYFDAISDRDFIVKRGEVYHEDAQHNNYRYHIIVPMQSESEDVNEAFTLHGDMDVKTNLFLRTISVKREDRFNYWLKEYEAAAARNQAGKIDPADHHSMMGIVVSGRVDTYPQYRYGDEAATRQGLTWDADKSVYYKVVCPSFFETFPAAGDYADLVLHNFWYASKKMNVASDGEFDTTDEYGNLDKKGSLYLFEKYANEGETFVEYEYFRADPTGWYLVALLCGGLAVLIVIAIAKSVDAQKKKTPKPTLKEQFPYDPFGDDSIDPFA